MYIINVSASVGGVCDDYACKMWVKSLYVSTIQYVAHTIQYVVHTYTHTCMPNNVHCKCVLIKYKFHCQHNQQTTMS